MLKRKAFSHEKEVRIIYYNDKITSQQITFPYQINPNIAFDELVIDPRIEESLYNEIKSDIKKAGFKNKIFQSGLYKIENFFFKANLP